MARCTQSKRSPFACSAALGMSCPLRLSSALPPTPALISCPSHLPRSCPLCSGKVNRLVGWLGPGLHALLLDLFLHDAGANAFFRSRLFAL